MLRLPFFGHFVHIVAVEVPQLVGKLAPLVVERGIKRFAGNVLPAAHQFIDADGGILPRYRNLADIVFRHIAHGEVNAVYIEPRADTVIARTGRSGEVEKYGEEQSRLIADVEQLENELDECKRVEKDLTGWIKRVKECLTIDNLTRTIVVELIDRIEVSEIYDVNGEKNLDISISYKFGYLNANRETDKKIEPVGNHQTKDDFSKKLYA